MLRRETYLCTPINYSEGMAEDQKVRYIRYLSEENQEHVLTEKAMQLVLEDSMARQKALEDWMAPLNRNIRRTEGVVVRRAQTAEIRTT